MLPTSHVPAEEQLIQHHEKPGDIVFQKEINSLPEKKKKHLRSIIQMKDNSKWPL